MVCLYVDDLIYPENGKILFDKFRESMMIEFDTADLGMMYYFPGIELNQLALGIFIQEILDRFWMKDCNAVSTAASWRSWRKKDR